jgi:hypothetical protein
MDKTGSVGQIFTVSFYTMRSKKTNVSHLRDFIGTRARYQGSLYEIIEILEDGPSLVLQNCDEHTTIQADQLGEAHRRVPETMTLPVTLSGTGEIDTKSVGLVLLDNDHLQVTQ